MGRALGRSCLSAIGGGMGRRSPRCLGISGAYDQASGMAPRLIPASGLARVSHTGDRAGRAVDGPTATGPDASWPVAPHCRVSTRHATSWNHCTRNDLLIPLLISTS
jgi:hypothetical protein